MPRIREAGYCLSCASATHIDIPARYTPGGDGGSRGRGLVLWKSEGPGAGGRLAACHYAKDPGGMPVPKSCCRAPQSFDFVAPGPWVRMPPPESPARASNATPIKESPPDSSAHHVFLSMLNSSVIPPVFPAKTPSPMPTSPASRAPSLQSSPSGLLSVNLSGCVSTSVSPGRWESPSQMAPLGPMRIKRSEREQTGGAQEMEFPRDLMQTPQMLKNAGKSGISGDDN